MARANHGTFRAPVRGHDPPVPSSSNGCPQPGRRASSAPRSGALCPGGFPPRARRVRPPARLAGARLRWPVPVPAPRAGPLEGCRLLPEDRGRAGPALSGRHRTDPGRPPVPDERGRAFEGPHPENRHTVFPRFFHCSKQEAKAVSAELAPEPQPVLRTVVTAVSPPASHRGARSGRAAACAEPRPGSGADAWRGDAPGGDFVSNGSPRRTTSRGTGCVRPSSGAPAPRHRRTPHGRSPSPPHHRLEGLPRQARGGSCSALPFDARGHDGDDPGDGAGSPSSSATRSGRGSSLGRGRPEALHLPGRATSRPPCAARCGNATEGGASGLWSRGESAARRCGWRSNHTRARGQGGRATTDNMRFLPVPQRPWRTGGLRRRTHGPVHGKRAGCGPPPVRG